MRQAAAAARQELLKLAAARLNVPVDTLTVKDGVVSVAGNAAKKVSYGELIGGKQFNVRITATGSGWDMKVAPEAKAKDLKDYKIVGTSAHRVELPAKLTGEFTYAHDVRVPGMLHGRVVRPPTITSKPVSVDESSVKNIPGIGKSRAGRKLRRRRGYETEWAAIKAAKGSKVSWAEPATKMPASAEAGLRLPQRTLRALRDQVTVNKGNPDAALSQATKTFEATYHWPFQLHGMLGPSCAVADVGKDRDYDSGRGRKDLSGHGRRSPSCWDSRERMFACSFASAPAATVA